jgi:hypothetical protein
VMGPEDAARLFEDLKSVAQQGEVPCLLKAGTDWGWITEVRQVPPLL